MAFQPSSACVKDLVKDGIHGDSNAWLQYFRIKNVRQQPTVPQGTILILRQVVGSGLLSCLGTAKDSVIGLVGE